MKLSIVIPAYNEEQAIGSIIERTLACRQAIIAESAVEQVEVIVVSDGSTDRTAEIARRYDDIHLIKFERNRGYGAAIKEGFEWASGDLVGFLDADGTCDPRFFATLCRALDEQNATVAIGARLGPDSRMPVIRRIGNRMYALILSTLTNKVVSDTASGMRVIRREALDRLYPLPDGLHFTPAMSARILMDDELTIIECPMPYEERVGESKLHVLRDGVRFFQTILEMALMWRPTRFFAAAAMGCLLLTSLLATHPLETWVRSGCLEEDMIYRLLFCSLLGAVGITMLSASVICRRLDHLWSNRQRPPSFLGSLVDRMFAIRTIATATIVATPIVGWLIGPGIWTRIVLGSVDLHWSRIVLAGLIVFCLVQALVASLVLNLIHFHLSRHDGLAFIHPRSARSADRRSLTAAQRAIIGDLPVPNHVIPQG